MNKKTLKTLETTLFELTIGYGCIHEMRKFLAMEQAKLELAESILDSLETFEMLDEE